MRRPNTIAWRSCWRLRRRTRAGSEKVTAGNLPRLYDECVALRGSLRVSKFLRVDSLLCDAEVVSLLAFPATAGWSLAGLPVQGSAG